MMMAAAFRNMDASLEEAARVSGAGAMRTLFRIVVPASAPMIFVASLMSLIRSFESFEVELVLGTPFRFSVYSTKIYSLIHQTPVNYGGATALSLFILFIFPLVVLQQWVTSRGRYTTLTSGYKPTLFPLGKWRWPIALGIFSVAALATIIPLIFLGMGSLMNLFGHFELERVWTLRHWGTVFKDPGFLSAFKNTIMLGFGTMALSVILFGFLAYVIARTDYFARSAFDLVTWLPFMIPGIILGLGYLFFSLRVALQFLYGSKILLVLILALTTMTFAVQILKSSLLQLGPDLEEAGRVMGGSFWFTLRRIVVPLMLPTAAVVAVMVFGSVNRQVSSIVLLTTAKSEPLSVLQLGYLMAEDYSAGAVVGTILVGLGLILAIAVRRLGYRFGAQYAGTLINIRISIIKGGQNHG